MKQLQSIGSFLQNSTLNKAQLSKIRGGKGIEKTNASSSLSDPGGDCLMDVDTTYDDEKGNRYCDRCYEQCE